jgi:NAD-dependent DNA ligase
MAKLKHDKDLDKLLMTWKSGRYSLKKLDDMKLSEEVLEKLARYLSSYYYNDEPLIEDKDFDTLVFKLKQVNPKNKFLTDSVRAPVAQSSRKKVRLVGWMSSLDKIYPSQGIESWVEKQGSASVSISDKLDGFSLELAYDNKGLATLTSGGDGIYGQDLNHLVPVLSGIPSGIKNMVIRCEGVMVKSKYQRFKNLFKTPRSALSNVFNNSKPNKDAIEATQLIALEIISPAGLTIDAQYKKLKSLGFEVPVNKLVPLRSFSEEYIRDYYQQRRTKSKYLIDGIVVIGNKTYVRPTKGNPKYAVAFKENSEDSIVEATVVDVQGNVSRTGRIVPLIIINPVEINGVTVTRITGHNYGYIQKTGIGKGAVIKVTRSGEVIPYVLAVVKKSKTPALPDGEEGVDWEWATELDIKLLTQKGSDADTTQQIKKIAHFASCVGIEGLKDGVAAKLYAGGITSPFKLVKYHSYKRLRKCGFGERESEILNQAISDVVDAGFEIPVLATALSAFGPGVGYAKIKAVEDAIGFERLRSESVATRLMMISMLRGFTIKTAEPIAEGVRKFYDWIEKTGVTIVESGSISVVSDKMAGRKVMFTGFRSSELEDWILRNGGEVVTSISRCNLLLTKDPDAKPSGKILQAQAKGITIMSASKFTKDFVRAD